MINQKEKNYEKLAGFYANSLPAEMEISDISSKISIHVSDRIQKAGCNIKRYVLYKLLGCPVIPSDKYFPEKGWNPKGYEVSEIKPDPLIDFSGLRGMLRRVHTPVGDPKALHPASFYYKPR